MCWFLWSWSCLAESDFPKTASFGSPFLPRLANPLIWYRFRRSGRRTSCSGKYAVTIILNVAHSGKGQKTGRVLAFTVHDVNALRSSYEIPAQRMADRDIMGTSHGSFAGMAVPRTKVSDWINPEA